MSLSSIRKVLYAKLETVYGTDSAPVAATDAVLCKSITFSEPLSQKNVERNVVRPFLGNFQNLLAGAFVKLDIEVEVAGFGTAGPATPTPGYDALMQICGLARTVTPGTSVAYTPVSSAFASATVYCYQDGTLHKILGARADLVSTFKPGEIPVHKYSVTGIYGGVTDVALPAPALGAYQTPLLVDSDNTTGISVLGYAAALNSFEFKLGNQVEMRELPGQIKQVLIVDRKATGSIEIEATPVAAKDWWTAMKTAVVGAFNLTHGITAGNIVSVASGQMQLLKPKFVDNQNIIHLGVDALFIPSAAGNDEFSITVT
jgi:hypothetical protein